MKISVDDQKIFSLSETQKKVIQHDILSEEFDADMKRRLQWILEEKYNRCFERLKNKWEPILATRLTSLPTDRDAFAELVFSQPEYENRTARETRIKNEKLKIK